ncbi:Rossmann-like and DUF2520 domain-containing protein [Dermabacter sp. HSID17554]|uniref:Rossmann-like and DUF2520 domain-containing protein n=1 Tax=Dermabacter sp. HSID17554 TaxID=2419511 RepID=UPI00237B0200|nr:DUF2520 domain-containing protein [Dermabacter sp. HSID17554]
MSPAEPARMGVGIISAGRVGAVLGNALRAAGHQVTGVVARSDASRERADVLLPGAPILSPEEVVERSELVVLAVPDDELAPLAASLAQRGIVPGAQIIAHTSGRYGIEVLRPLEDAGAITLALHPAMTFTGTSLDLARLVGCPWAVTARPMFAPIAKALVLELDGVSIDIAEGDRTAYHAALAHGSNHLVVLVSQVLQILDAIGVEDPPALVRPLLNASLEESLRLGPGALTGPVQRGDAGTVGNHLEALEELDLERVLPTYRALARAALDIAPIGERERAALELLLSSERKPRQDS